MRVDEFLEEENVMDQAKVNSQEANTPGFWTASVKKIHPSESSSKPSVTSHSVTAHKIWTGCKLDSYTGTLSITLGDFVAAWLGGASILRTWSGTEIQQQCDIAEPPFQHLSTHWLREHQRLLLWNDQGTEAQALNMQL